MHVSEEEVDQEAQDELDDETLQMQLLMKVKQELPEDDAAPSEDEQILLNPALPRWPSLQ